ncbi:MAG: hypothetical protein AAGH70_08365, partial [Pseudomonadota bacterium]
RAAVGGPRLLGTVPITPNGATSVVIPEGVDVVAVHRVYDARGRYDETVQLPLMQPDDRGQLDKVEEGTQSTARRGIRVEGGTVTVSASDMAQGAVLRTLGETVRPDAQGRAVIERILPSGDYDIGVAVEGGGQTLAVERPVRVTGAEWFYVVTGDLTFGRYKDGQTGESDTRVTGRLQGYVDGETDSGTRVTASIDTREGEIDEIFRRLDEKDPASTIERIDALDGYPTYGDDSTIVDDTPTSGRVFVRIEQDNSFLQLGDGQASLDGNGYVRNERTLYGLTGRYESQTTTARGDARVSVDAYVADSDQLRGRDVFRGTGGSVYFLEQQDLSPGTEVVTVELRDAVTGRIIDQVRLVEGRDYQINHLQGVVTLNQPLTDSVDSNLISTNPGGDAVYNLVVQYEFTPIGTEIDGLSYGARVEAWVTDDVRLGVSTTLDDDGVDEQRNTGVDIRYEMGDNSFVQLDYAESDGPGVDSNVSTDGGLVFNSSNPAGGTGSAAKIEAQVDLADLGSDMKGVIGGYVEQREEGFTSLDYSVDATTGDETLYGVFARVEPSDTLGFGVYADIYENDAGSDRTELGVEVASQINDRTKLELGVEYVDQTAGGGVIAQSGSRTDAAARLTYKAQENLTVYGFAQATLSSDGLDDNERYGLGLTSKIGQSWTVAGEVSGGEGGTGGRVLATHAPDANNSTYFGYELDAGRALDAGISPSDNGGRFVVGSQRQINDEVSVFTENTYDIFGTSREQIGAYGVTYRPADFVAYTATVDIGRLEDTADGDVDRTALSFGVRYEDEMTTARARIEYRVDSYEDVAQDDTDALFLIADLQHKFSDEARLLFSLDAAFTEADGSSFIEGELVDASLGYAFRPIMNERLNVLARYRYLNDDFGQEVDGVVGAGPVQESHVASVEANYDLNEDWTVAGKFGARLTESAATSGGVKTSNDAWIAVANARYHIVHNWDALIELRHLELSDAGSSETAILGAAYRHFGNNLKVGLGYNFGRISDDLTDLTFDDEGLFLNIIAKY